MTNNSNQGHNKNQTGIALMQVLLISAVISVLALYFTLTARQQVHVAQLANDKTLAILHIKTVQTKILMDLLTRESGRNSEKPLPAEYNFFGKPFKQGEFVTVKIQDVSGLLSVQYPNEDVLRRVLKRLGVDEERAEHIKDSLRDWQDEDDLRRLNGAEKDVYVLGPRNRPVSIINEIELVSGMDTKLATSLLPLFRNERASYFNPLLAPEILLQAFLNSDAQDIIAMRNAGQLTSTLFSQLSGVYEREGVVFSKSGHYRITLTAHVGDVTLSKKISVELEPYVNSPKVVIDKFSEQW